ncbi:AbrB/MazE/SpoVT family DNA-binding domain-containing protein [Vibrio fluvialis]|nr:AbrB/MazE/SpoVT family DNA-binding domain-containing protein [Vibrio fluvialis]
MSQVIAKWGHSAAVRLPAQVLKTINMVVGDVVDIMVVDNRIIIEPSKPSLNQLLSQITAENRHNELINEPIGKELL